MSEEKTKAKEEEKEWWEKEFEDKWWHKISWVRDKGDVEPAGVMLFIDYMLDQAIITPEAVKIASLIPHRLILLEIFHPKKKMIERLSFMISPTSVDPAVPDTEPDLVFRFNYYDLANFLTGKVNDFSLGVWLGRAEVFGNLVALLDESDILEVAAGKKIDEAKNSRPKFWPVGFP
ncbi:MAG: hypothetical protein ACTSX4_03035 [Candidatus Helarchaeota archaeon]